MAEITAKQAAEYFIAVSRDHGDPITNLKLQKLLYYAQGWYLALYDKPLFEERIEAWLHGPVVPPIYGEFKKWKWEPIGGEVAVPNLSANVKAHLDEVMQVFGVHTAYQLERMTHSEKPWRDARRGIAADESSDAIMPTESMKHFFRAVLAAQK